MAYGGTRKWEMICPVCNIFIETNIDDDFQSSIDYHFLKMHPTLSKTSQSNIQPSKNVKYTSEKNTLLLKTECTNYIFCPVCDCVVEIFQDNVSRCFQDHFEICHQNSSKIQPADYTYTVGGNKNQDMDYKNAEKNKNYFLNDLGKMILDNQSNRLCSLQQNFEKHHGYIKLCEDSFLCQICSVSVDTTQLMHEHLKSKRHEDNTINYLKNKLPNHMHNMMEFVSFYDSNLCCNLCRCKIELNSNNPHETLMNIISHNLDNKHSKKKCRGDTCENSVDSSELRSITERNSLINEHRHFIDTEMEPHFKCNLCGKTIHYSKNGRELEQNFLTHINSSLHNRNSKAMLVLQTFNEIVGNRQGMCTYFVLNGCINCAQCKHTVETSIEKLLEHSQSHKDMNQLIQNQSEIYEHFSSSKPHVSKRNFKKYSSSCQRPDLGMTINNSEINRGKIIHLKTNKSKETKKPDVKEILRPLHKQFGNISCIAENGEGSLTCLICNCPVQLSTHCVKMHMMGKFHKNKMQYQIKEFNNLNLNYGGTHQQPYDDLVENIFQSLPQEFQEEKVNFKNCPVGGFISCVLCECVINPYFLEFHLQEDTHIREKQLKRS